MEKPSIPDEVRRFVLLHVPSVPFLEALLLLRQEREREWTAAMLASRLYLSEKAATDLLAALQRSEFLDHCEVNRPDCYRYAPKSSAIAAIIDQTAAAYSANIVEISHLIHSKLQSQARQFADAFKWRKDS